MNTTIDFKFTRIASIDVFRAITMMFMIFVNDFFTDIDVPHWLEHAKVGEDLLGFSDVIFPAFLFAVGLSIPFALEKRITKGDSFLKMGWHITSRTIALIVMGLFTLNYLFSINYTGISVESGISIPVFGILMVIGFFLIWNLYPKANGWKKHLFVVLQIIGVALLVYIAIVFRDGNGKNIQIHNWEFGVLATIGWTYLSCTLIYLIFRKRLSVMLIILAAFILFRVFAYKLHYHGIIPGNGAYHSFTMAGIIVSLLCGKYGSTDKIKKLFSILILSGISMLLVGIWAHRWWIVSKLDQTIPFILICIGINVLFYAFLYWLTDNKRKEHWFNIIKPAGTATLTCYLLPYLVYSIFMILNFKSPELIIKFPIGLIKSMAFALLIIWITALLGKIHIKLKV